MFIPQNPQNGEEYKPTLRPLVHIGWMIENPEKKSMSDIIDYMQWQGAIDGITPKVIIFLCKLSRYCERDDLMKFFKKSLLQLVKQKHLDKDKVKCIFEYRKNIVTRPLTKPEKRVHFGQVEVRFEYTDFENSTLIENSTFEYDIDTWNMVRYILMNRELEQD